MVESTVVVAPRAGGGVVPAGRAGSDIVDASAVGVAAELVARMVAEQPVVGECPPRERMMIAAWLSGLRSQRTRRAYARDVMVWWRWCTDRGVELLAAQRVHVDMWVLA